jgi:hypothetical protein
MRTTRLLAVKFETRAIVVVKTSRMRFKLIEFSFICLMFFVGILKSSSEECGKKSFIDNPLSFGGQMTRKNEWPWTVRQTTEFFISYIKLYLIGFVC